MLSEEKPKKLPQVCYELAYLGTGHGRSKYPKGKDILFPKARGKFLNPMSETQEGNKPQKTQSAMVYFDINV